MIRRLLALYVAVVTCGACATRPAENVAQHSGACLVPGGWYDTTRRPVQKTSEWQVLHEAARRDVVLVGEDHDNADHHLWQLQVLAALHLLRPAVVIGFEAFPRRTQPILDQWTAG